ncbi:MAG: carbohydrate-binding domain-containing protein, partial [Lachnospiraceae bacterium]|nr:carbohydrate-binding domain-containing protein [Lachnospiraceae bacterium]
MKATKKRIFGILLSLALVLGTMPALGMRVHANDATEYGIWVGDAEVTSANLSGQGWSYDVASNTLTLNNFNYEGDGHHWESDTTENRAAIYAENDLTVQIKGTNTIKGNVSETIWIYGIYGEKTLTINGGGVLAFPQSGIDDSIVVQDGDLIVNNTTINTTEKRCGLHTFNGDLYINGGKINTEKSSWTGIAVNAGNLEINNATVNSSATEDGILADGAIIINSGSVTCVSDEDCGIRVFGKLEINGGSVKTSGVQDTSVYVNNFEMNGGRLEAVAPQKNGIYVDSGDAVIKGGTLIASGRYGINASRRIYFNGGDATFSGTQKAVRANGKLILSDKATVTAGEHEASAVDVTSTFAKEHDQKWAHLVVPTPVPSDPTAVGTVHGVPSSVGKYVVTSANTVSLVKAPRTASYTLPATVT